MKKNIKKEFVDLVLRDQLEQEIQKHKWIESQKIGKDIGFEKAQQDWMDNHFPGWKRREWRKALQEISEQPRKRSNVTQKSPQEV